MVVIGVALVAWCNEGRSVAAKCFEATCWKRDASRSDSGQIATYALARAAPRRDSLLNYRSLGSVFSAYDGQDENGAGASIER